MKKIIISVAAAMVFSMSTSYADFEFSEKDIVHADKVTIQDGLIVTYDVGYMGSNMEEYHTHFQYWDLSGNKAIEPLSEETPQYFTYNRQSIVEKTDGKNILKDINGNIILSELPRLYNARSSRTRVIYSGDSDNVKYGLMAYDGRIIIPMQYDRLNIISDEYYLAGSDEANIIYNYYGDIILEIPSNIMVTYIGSDGAITYLTDDMNYLLDYNGADINVEFNGKRINSYSIGGEMLIRPEDIAGDGISIEYNDAERMLYMNIDGLEQRQ